MQKSIIIFLFLIIGFSFNVSAQIPYLLKADAQEMISNGNIYGAIDKLEKYTNLRPNNSKEIRQLAELYEISRNYQKAATYYYKSYEIDKDENIISLFDASRMLQMTGAYETALKDFQTFKKVYKGSNTSREIKKLADSHIAGCILSDSLLNSPLKVEIDQLDTTINKVYSEFSPFPLNDSVFIYASLKSDKYIKSTEENIQKQFYLARKVDEVWTGGDEFDEIFNYSGEISGNGALSDDKNRFYFTRCQRDLKNKLICALYLSSKTDGKWETPNKLKNDINLRKFNSTQPAVAIDQKNKNREIVYFASDREGGKGKYDIWYFTYDKRKNEFSYVKNAGSINTAGNEMTPFFSAKKMSLFFSSDGHPGLGGFDIFKTTGTKRNWSDPVNVGFPINSNADDLYYCLFTDKNEGFIVSNRYGSVSFESYSCCDDIYSFNYLQYASLNIFGGVNIPREIIEVEKIEPKSPEIYDFSTDEIIQDALKTLDLDEDYFEDGQTRVDSLRLVKDIIIVDLLLHTSDIDKVKDKLFEILSKNHPNISELQWKDYLINRKAQISTIPKSEIPVFESITANFLSFIGPIDNELTPNDSILLMSELYAVDHLIRENSIVLLYETFNTINAIIPDLTEEQWNNYIEKRRMELEEKYGRGIINSGLPYGSLADIEVDYKRTYISLYYIDPLTHEQILIKKDSVWPDGKFKLEAIPGNNYKLVAESPGFLRKSYDFSTKNTQWSDTLNLDINLIPLNDQPIVLENIYFDFDSDILRQEVKECLDTTLYKVLVDNPEISIEFSAHTDSKGSVPYNENLSQKRAESVVKYIQEKGIPSHRVVAKGYGESMPIAPNEKPDGSDNPEGRKKNRRVEFKVIKIEEIKE